MESSAAARDEIPKAELLVSLKRNSIRLFVSKLKTWIGLIFCLAKLRTEISDGHH